ncbi:PREDICTED: nuclear pore complex protein Nup107 [Nicrophorus vespilloides]|uniref:Nuclear pore complex protein n=1 Tax=Nicrophorus vespilloides TaxID=110193 RepID=A0ABM1M7V4_NICVS|nr:PREDICTED: nuclear pore complex protein Nup107 [Nicrophorus vespilloides]
MDIDLDRSVRLLDEAVASKSKNIFRRGAKQLRKQNLQLSIDLSESEMKLFTDESTFYNESFNAVLNENKTLTGSIIRSNEPWKNTTDSLYMEFFEVLQTASESNEILNVIAEMSRCCSDSLNVIKGLKSKVSSTGDSDLWLENERNTWRLIYVLYGNRLGDTAMEEEDMPIYFGQSERYCMLSLFKRDALVRESQLVIDWLESNAAQRDDEVLHFSDSTVGWENTLHQLKSKETIVFESSRTIVKHLDADAPHYEKLPLHDLDMEDERRLCHKIFQEIRCGKLEAAQKLCGNCGHSWRAALLEGWKLYHNPNLEDPMNQEDEEVDNSNAMETEEVKYKDIEGNENRDIWKAMAWKYCDVETLNKFEKAAVAAYSGNLQPLLHVCSSWEDHLWAYMRVMIDIRVESDIRENCMKTYADMPEEYWDQKMSINEIFNCLESCNNAIVQTDAMTPDHLIQKYLILDEINKLVEAVEDWLLEPAISMQFLRFLTHLMLFLEQIGQVSNREVVERVLEEYIKRLIEDRHTQLVAFYVNKLNDTMQVIIYSTYLETIINAEDRKEALNFAEESELNIHAITAKVVENIRGKNDPEFDGNLQRKITQCDEYKISALDWLLFYDTQLPEALKQTNAMIFMFLTMKKLDAAQLAFNKLPVDLVNKLTKESEPSANVQQNIREHLSYKAYLDAQEAFNNWFKNFKAKPNPPETPGDSAPFTEKVAYEHRLSQYNAELGRWKLMIGQLSKVAKNALYNVLLFPDGGWLHGAKDAHYLQSTCIPECTLLLYNVLRESEDYEECVQLADILTSEKHKLYSMYSKDKLGEIFVKLSEISVQLLMQKKDPWGNEMTA